MPTTKKSYKKAFKCHILTTPMVREGERQWRKGKLLPVSYHVIMSKGKEQEKAKENLSELLGVFEEGIEKDFPTKSPFFNGETLGFLGMVVGSNACNYLVFQEAAAVIIDPKKHPAFLSWVTALKDCPLMKETLPLHVKLVAKMKADYFPDP
ncbi:hypothetical protein L1049_005664 [Liquidambar formosana]|uniref:Uncharacterized protein n=1 Tax=Liquidambar formosana TaxID=63359 RepID=A0AAP0RG32_LIQFO